MISLFAAITVFFSPLGGCEQQIVKDINGAQKVVLEQMYSFTSQPITDALIAAHKRGVEVHVIFDRSWRDQMTRNHHPLTQEDALVAAGIDVLIDRKHAIAHNKVRVIDGTIVLTGSFNDTGQAEHGNAENIVRITGNAAIVQAYIANFAKHASHSVKP
jgi:phosphatidylserine/phosphatidylglycerophosphate/cardiolipin synthase-like enzyme